MYEVVYGFGEGVGVVVVFGFDVERYDGVGDVYGVYVVRKVIVGEGIIGGVFNVEDGINFIGINFGYVFYFIGVYVDDVGNVDFFVIVGVEEVLVFFQGVLVDMYVGELIVRVFFQFEGEVDKGKRVVGK